MSIFRSKWKSRDRPRRSPFLHSALRFARLGSANDMRRAMAKRTIRQLTTSNFDFPTLAQSTNKKYVDKTGL